MTRLRVKRGDITTLAVDAIVNAANRSLLGGAGVDGAIHRGAGPALLEACQAIDQVESGVRCPTGEARITPAFDLPARFVIHTVGPVWRGGDDGEPKLLADCYRNSLRVAAQNELATIAFPAISCGVYRFPISKACEIAVKTTAEFLQSNDSITEVTFVAFEESIYDLLQSELIRNQPKHSPQ